MLGKRPTTYCLATHAVGEQNSQFYLKITIQFSDSLEAGERGIVERGKQG